ncbi:MAG TPA: EAL domain-containing protein, partial [Thermoleophilia bacterium]|nr:EAL domain-containing protein [Thermoleophilia bacterium]
SPLTPRRRTSAVLGFSALILGVAAVLQVGPLAGSGRLPSAPHVPWEAVAAAFALTDIFVIHVPLRRNAYTISCSEVPLVIGLLVLPPPLLLLSRLVAGAPVLILHRRQAPMKVVFNLCNNAINMSVVAAVYRAVLGHGSPLTPGGWGAAFAALVAGHLVDTCTITIAASLASGSLQRSVLRTIMTMGLIGAVANTALALGAVSMVWRDRAAAWFLAAIAAALFLAYRAFISLSQRYGRLELLYGFTKSLSDSSRTDDLLAAILAQAAQLLRAEWAEVVLVNGDDEGLCLSLDEGGSVRRRRLSRDPGMLEEEVIAGAQSRLLRRSKHDSETWRVVCADQPVRDALIAPLRGDSGVLGVLAVANRLDDVSTFDGEDLKLFETLAAHATVAFEKEQLIEQLRQELTDKEYQSLHDSLTGLGNRAFFHRCVTAALGQAGAHNRQVAVMLIDLDRFKEVNDTLGHHTGDRLLKHISSRLSTHLRDAHIARLGGDEFAICLPAVSNQEEALRAAEEIRSFVEEPVMLGDITVDVGASVGVALFPEHGRDSSTLLQRADVAMYSAKSESTGTAIYSPESDSYNPRRLSLAGELRAAISQGELLVYYQPIANLATGRIERVEALVRWNHPKHGILSPDEFVPLAEHTGTISALTSYVLRQSLQQVRRWQALELDLGVSVNLSVRVLMDVGLPADVAEALASSGVDPHALNLEITESMIMADPKRIIGVLHRLADLGMELAVDDFGTGYSSLGYLRQLPVSEVKIDKSFVLHLAEQQNDNVIVRSIVDLANNLGLRTVAEGVENRDSLDRLAALGCNDIQGYLLSRPQPAEALTMCLLERGTNLRTWLEPEEPGERIPRLITPGTSRLVTPSRR